MAKNKTASETVATDNASETAATTKMCRGMAKVGIAPHEAPLAAFGNFKASKDGLMSFCKRCDAAYQAAWRTAKKAGVTLEAFVTSDESDAVIDAVLARPITDFAVARVARVASVVDDAPAVDGTATQEQEHAALEAAVESNGGVETEESQALLAQAAATAAQARRDARNARRRAARAAAKA